jgi:hypothetical protein
MEALLGVETPPNKTLELFALSLSGRCRIAFSRLGFPKSDVVLRGPFEGLKLVAGHPTADPSIAELLGVYKHELRDIAAGGDAWDRVVNIGSAAGSTMPWASRDATPDVP